MSATTDAPIGTRAAAVVAETIDLMVRRATECIDQHRPDLAMKLLLEVRMLHSMRRAAEHPDQHEAGQVVAAAQSRWRAYLTSGHLTGLELVDLARVHDAAGGKRLAELHGREV